MRAGRKRSAAANWRRGAKDSAASLCKRQQCTLERRGFRQELDSWRHKLIHCVGFESILEGLFGPGVVKDSTLFQGKIYSYTMSEGHVVWLTFLSRNMLNEVEGQK
uniref:Uncharacterized protein n=1 Tax=Hippocampus comes TaxID=109280 RepID=A0A3Q2XS09_HIPCM